jgi:predicted MFS family arabinose efflux permease
MGLEIDTIGYCMMAGALACFIVSPLYNVLAKRLVVKYILLALTLMFVIFELIMSF